uniref:Uncharacterized protein n=1 Tax=Micrurus carvalhoi TaxID=3147026 RepID=A0A2H6NEQ1_9SAUR
MCHCHFALPSLFCCRHGLWTWGYPRISLPTQLLAMDAGNPQPGGKAYLGCGRKPGHDSGGRKVAGAALGCPGTFDLLCSGEYLSWASGGLCLSSYLHGDLQSALLVFRSHLRNAGFPWRGLSGPQANHGRQYCLKDTSGANESGSHALASHSFSVETDHSY